MTSPSGRRLSATELAQRQRASQAAALRRQQEGLTTKELAQRRSKGWKQGEIRRKEINKSEIQRSGKRRDRISERGESFVQTEAQKDRNITRLNKHWGIPIETIINNRFDQVGHDNHALQSFLTKWSNLRRKGLSPTETVSILERRFEGVRRRDQLDSFSLLDLIRENYSPARRLLYNARKRNLTERQRERRRLSQQRRRAA